MTSSNLKAARSLVLSGCLLLLSGLIFGVFVHATPNPRIGLAAHVQMTSEGIMSIVAGLLMASEDICTISDLQCKIVAWAHYSLWLQCGSEVLGAFTGAAQTLLIATEQGGSGSASDFVEGVIGLLHFGPGVSLMVAYSILSLGVWRCMQAEKDKAA